MATDTRRIVFDFIGRDNVSRTTRQVGGEIEGLHGKVGKLSGMMGGALKTGALAGGAALAMAGGSAVVFGVKTAASMEQAQIGFTNMLGSAEKAQKFLVQLQKFAAATPFEFRDVQRGAQRLLAMGFAADKIIPTLTAIGDSVAAMGGSAEQIDQVTLAIGQMNAKQKISTEEMMQLTEVGIPAFQILADKMHMTVPELQDMMSQAQGVGASELFRKGGMQALLDGLEHGTKSFKGFSGMMAQQSKSLSGLWSTLKDNVSLALANMVTPFMPALKAGLNGLVGLTGKLSSGMKTLTGVAQGAGKEFKAGFSYGAKTGETIKSTSRLRDLAAQLGVAWRNLSGWFKRDILPAFNELRAAVQKIMPVMMKMDREILGEAITQFKKVAKTIGDNSGDLKNLARVVGVVVVGAYKLLSPIVTKFAKTDLKLLGTWISLSIKSFAFFGRVIGDFAKQAKITGQNAQKVWKDVSGGAMKMKDLGVKAFNTMAKVFLDMAEKLIKGAARAFGWVPGLGPKLRDAAKKVSDFKDQTNAAMNKLSKGKTVPVRIRATTTGGALFEIGKGFVTRARGGPIPHVGPGSSEAYDSVPALLRVNEHVWTPEEVKGVGGHGKVMKLRQMAKRGLLQGFAGGGPVGSGFGVSVDAPSRGDMQRDVWGPINGGIMQIIRAMAKEIAKLAGGATAVVAAARSMIGYPYSWGGGGRGGPGYGIGRGAGTYGFDCSGLTEYAWWKGAHVGIGGVTDPQWASSHQIPGPRPGALGFPHGPSVHVMLASDKPGYVIQAPFTGSHVQEVQRSSPMWRWPNAAKYAAGGAVRKLGRDFVMGFAGPGDRWAARAAGIAGSRALGGPVSAGLPYLVGERGPEVIVPRQGGTVHPAGSRVEIHHHHHWEVKVPPTVDKGSVGREINEALRAFKLRGGKLVTA